MTAAAQPALSPASVFVRKGFAWDAQGAYLFDIDGTLLRESSRVHYDSFFLASEAVLGHALSLDGVVLHGSTDPGILRDAFALAKLEDSAWRESLDRISGHMCDHVEERRADLQVRVMPGVTRALALLKEKGAALGVATGNLERIGWLKIEAAGLREWFTFGGFSDGFDLRVEMIGHALKRARAAAGAASSVCVVGDTPADIAAARAHGLPTIAVATGNYSFDELMRSEPEACATTLDDLLDASAERGR